MQGSELTGDVFFEGEVIPCDPDKTLLQNLLDHGVVLPYGCCQGRCGACKLRAQGSAMIPHQDALLPSERGQCLLVCHAFPPQQGELHLSEPIVSTRFQGVVTKITTASSDILRLSLKGPGRWQAGQFVSLYRDNGAHRCYSLANAPYAKKSVNDDHVTSHPVTSHRVKSSAVKDSEKSFHIRLRDKGELSQWLGQCREGDIVEYGAAQGQPWEAEPKAPILLVGTGTGIAPLLAIAQAQLMAFPESQILCFWAMPNQHHFYCWPEWAELMAMHPNLLCIPVVRRVDGLASTDVAMDMMLDVTALKQTLLVKTENVPHTKRRPPQIALGELVDVIKKSQLGFSISQARVALAGNPKTVQDLSKWLFLQGVAKQRMHLDPFDG